MKGGVAVTQIVLLILGVIAIGFIVGSEVENVSAVGDPPPNFFSNGAKLAQVTQRPIANVLPQEIVAQGLNNQPLIGITVKKSALKTFLTSSSLKSAMWAAAGASLGKMFWKVVGSSEQNLRRTKNIATAVTLAATAASFVGAGGLTSTFTSSFAGAFANLIGLGANPLAMLPIGFALVVIIAGLTRKIYSHEIITYRVGIWQPSLKEQNCQDCNNLEFGCSKYQCKTYGVACELLNPGTDHELCDKVSDLEIGPPTMKPLDILEEGYKYNPDNSVALPDTGFDLEYNGGCLPAFKGINFAIKTNEPAQCRIDMNRTFNYEDMAQEMLEGTMFTYNHTFSIPNVDVPSSYALDQAGFEIEEGNNYQFYMRCMDVNGNDSPYSLGIKFCVDSGPDNTATKIKTNYESGAYIKSNTTEINDLEVYTNKPAICRWDYTDMSYEKMANEMQDCSIDYGAYTFPQSYSYGCRTNLKGFKDNELNTYYIRCEDKPNLNSTENNGEKRISNKESYKLELQGTKNIVIDKILLDGKREIYSYDKGSINGIIISDSTSEISVPINVLTSNGADKEGGARCSYINSGIEYEFYNNQNYDYTNNNNHNWNLEEGNYNFDIKCCDVANNCETKNINFDVKSDTSPPQITRSYYENNLMKLVTNEESSCVYSLSTCNYDINDGLKLETKDHLNHFAPWDEKESLFVKCRDAYQNYPDDCSIIVRPQYE